MGFSEFITELENWKTVTANCSPAERGVLFDFLILVFFLPFSGAAYENGIAITEATVTTRLGGSETAALLASLIAKDFIRVWTGSSLAQLHVVREDLCPAFPVGMLYVPRLVKAEIERLAEIV